MYPRANIVVYGLWDGFINSKDRGLTGNGRPVTMGARFNELVRFLMQSNIARDVDIRFIDLMVDDPGSAYYTVKSLMDEGYQLPLVMMNERLKYAGDIPVWNIYNEAKMITENGCMIPY